MFSSDPKLGFFSQRDRFKEALDNGEVLAPAKSLDDMQKVVTNSTVDGILAAFFAILIVIVILDATRICIKAIRSREPLPTTEVPAEESQLFAPAGLFARAEELEPAGRHDGPRAPSPACAGTCARSRGRARTTATSSIAGATIPGEPVMSRRDFERRRQDAREARPQARCC